MPSMEYGSLHETELATLQSDLADVNETLESVRNVVVDLSELTMFGSAFLQILFDQIAPVKMLGIKVALCGDKTGLLALMPRSCVLTSQLSRSSNGLGGDAMQPSAPCRFG